MRILVVLLFTTNLIFSQGIYDAYRLSNRDLGVDSKSKSMGIAYYGIVDNGSALIFNPAGLNLIPKKELNFGLGILIGNNTNDFLNQKTTSNFNSEYINNISITLPISYWDNRYTFSLAYFREFNFNNINSGLGFNTNSSFIGFETNQDIAEKLKLANSNNTPLQNNLEQNYKITEDGYLDKFVIGFAGDITKKITLGLSLSANLGEFSYQRSIIEADTKNNYQVLENDFSNIDFSDWRYKENIRQEFSGILLTLGILVKPTDNSRISFSFDIPNYINVDDRSSFETHANFDNGDFAKYPTLKDISSNQKVLYNEYMVTLPMKFRAGYSINLKNLTLSAGAEYQSLNNLEFSSNNLAIEENNQFIDENIDYLLKWGLGAEYYINTLPLFLRFSYSNSNNPLIDNNLNLGSSNQFGFGLGYLIGEDFLLDLTYTALISKTENELYKSFMNPIKSQYFKSNLFNSTINIGFSYRF